jgi:2'-hydroxyisoflavone reductase
MKLLILGGTVFVGRHLAEAARVRGHSVTLFNRGTRSNTSDLAGTRSNTSDLAGTRSNTSDLAGSDIEYLIGNRDPAIEPGLAALENGTWDAVIDTSGYVPRLVEASAQALHGRVGRYCFVSSISVYQNFAATGTDEAAAVGQLAEPTEEITGESYGPLKVLCERAVQEIYGDGQSLIVRPGLIVGSHDPTDRFSYWVERVARGGTVLWPETKALESQFIDAHDLAAWIILALEQDISGVFNATGPTTTLGAVWETLQATLNPNAEAVWCPAALLKQHQVRPWMGPESLPLWTASAEGEDGFARISSARAVAAGLRTRPLAETVAETWAWLQTRPADYGWRAGLSAEAELLAAMAT